MLRCSSLTQNLSFSSRIIFLCFVFRNKQCLFHNAALIWIPYNEEKFVFRWVRFEFMNVLYNSFEIKIFMKAYGEVEV